MEGYLHSGMKKQTWMEVMHRRNFQHNKEGAFIPVELCFAQADEKVVWGGSICICDGMDGVVGRSAIG